MRSSEGPGQGRSLFWLVWGRAEWRDAQAGWGRPAPPKTAGVRRELGGRRHPRRRGRSRDRSCHPAAGPRQKTAARGRASSARRHATDNARRRPEGQRTAGPPTARLRECSPEVSPPRSLQIPLLFVWRTWRPRGFRGVAAVARAGQPLLASPGVTGDGSERMESPDRVRRVVPSVQAPSREGWGVGGVFSIHSRKARFETGKLFLGVPGRGIDCCDGFTGLARLSTLFCFLGTAFRREYCQRGRGRQGCSEVTI